MLIYFVSPAPVNVQAAKQVFVMHRKGCNPSIVIGFGVITHEDFCLGVLASFSDACKKDPEDICRFFVANKPCNWNAFIIVVYNKYSY